MSESKTKSSGVTVFKWIALCLFIGLLIAAAIPNFVEPRAHYAENACVNNLREIEMAAEQFALEKKKTKGDPINFPDDLTPYIKLPKSGKIMSCPAGGTYSIKQVGDKPTCSLGTNVYPPHVLP